MTIRDILNAADANRLPAALQQIKFGDVLNRILGGADVNVPAAVATANAATQTGAYVQADVQSIATLANQLKTTLNLLITAVGGIGGVTEQGLSPSSNVATLANVPSSLLSIIATAGTVTGMKTILRGPVSGAGALTPATGQVVWDGGKKLLFAAADAVSTVDVAYTRTADTTVSVLNRDLGQQDTIQ